MSEESAPTDPRLTEARNPRTTGIDRADPRGIVEMIQTEDRTVPGAVAEEAEAIAAMVEDVADRLRRGGRLFYVGAGTSGRLGVLDAAECPPTFGTDPELVQGIIAGGREALVRSQEGAEDDRGAGRAAVRDAGVTGRDFVLGIATSGTTPYVQAAVEEARSLGAGTGFLSCTPPPEAMVDAADHLVTPLVGPEAITGSTRMKAGTATKLVLNTLSTAVMVRLGKVYGNLMVDLRAVSRKLVGRSVRIVRELCGVGDTEARRALLDAGGSAKAAVAMQELGVGRAVAERALDACGGFLGEVLERWGGADHVPYYAGYPEDFGPHDARRLRARLDRGPARLEAALEEAARHDDGLVGTAALGGWSAAQHLAHLVECEAPAYRRRVEEIVAPARPSSDGGDAGASAGADRDGGEGSREGGSGRPGDADPLLPLFPDWEPGDPPPLSDRTPEELLERFRAERGRTLETLEALGQDDWHRRAVVAGEEVALHQLLRGMAHHDEAHAQRVSQWIHPDLAAPLEDGPAAGDAAAAGGDELPAGGRGSSG